MKHSAPFDFDEVVDRTASNSLKWDGLHVMLSPEQAALKPLPMWVADMDFKSPQPVIDALTERAQHGVFGYSNIENTAYLDAVTGWQKRRFDWDVHRDWVVPTAGIITAIKCMIQAFSAPGDTILIQPPVYAHFRDDVLLNGRFPTLAPLTRDRDRYVYDANGFEAAIKPNTALFILSNPHNPTGNVWTREELLSMGEICARHGVLVISDEIHQDLIMNPACQHLPFASLSDDFAQNSLTCTATSKTFNLPGLQSANVFIPNPKLRAEFKRQYDRNLFPLGNVMGQVATEAAYNHGEPWLDAMLANVRANHIRFAEGVASLNCGLRVLPTDSLYLAWMDCREISSDPDHLHNMLLTKARLWFDLGSKYGLEGYGYTRVNLGCSKATVDDALGRLGTAFGS
ncbi:MAG: MalY/PatB family protein [Pseudomonadota bacterium]